MLTGTAALAGSAAVPLARAADLRIGINAGVSFNESELQVRRRYDDLLDTLGRASGHRLEFGALYSDRVAQSLSSGEFDFLLVHTHAAMRAERETGHRVLALSDDRKDNIVYFFVRPDSPLTQVSELASAPIGAPGAQSWATATARAALRSLRPRHEPAFRTTRFQDAVPLMVELKTVPAGISRSKALVDAGVASQRLRVVHATEPRPLYALLASPGVPDDTVHRLRLAVAALGPSRAYDGTPFKSLVDPAPQMAGVRAFFAG